MLPAEQADGSSVRRDRDARDARVARRIRCLETSEWETGCACGAWRSDDVSARVHNISIQPHFFGLLIKNKLLFYWFLTVEYG